MPFALAEFFWVGIVPCVAAAVAMFVCRRSRMRPAAAWAVAIGCGLVVGQFGLEVRVGWSAALAKLLRPHEARDWLPWAVLVAASVSVLAGYSPRSWQRWIAAAACLIAIALPYRLLAGSIYMVSRWSGIEKLSALAFWAAALAILWLLLALGRANGMPRIRGGLVVITALGMAATITLSGAFTYGELCGVIAAALVGAFIGEACFRTPGDPADPAATTGPSGAAGPLAVMLGAMILLGYFHAELTATNAALLGIAVAAAAGWLPTGWPRRPAWQAALRTALCLVPLVLAEALAWAKAAAESAENPYV